MWVGEITPRIPWSSWGITAAERRQYIIWREFRDKQGRQFGKKGKEVAGQKDNEA